MPNIVRVTRKMASVVNRRVVVVLIALVLVLIIGLEMQITIMQSTIKEFSSSNHVLQRLRYDDDHKNMVSSINVESTLNFRPIVLYNRIPKTGSTSFTQQVYAMTKKNKIFVTHLNVTKNSWKMSLADQYDFVWNVTKWRDKQPVFYHGHFAYIPFSRFGALEPLYINILREPLDRLVSYYYFLRYGDDYRKGLKRVKQGDTTTFDECVAKNGRDCQSQKMWLQIPMMCGQIAECWKPGSQWALDEAKKNLRSKFLLVGLTEQMEDFVVVLEATVPSMFRGMTESYREGKKSYVRKTLHKDSLSNATVAKLKNSKVYRMERELYDTAVKEFNFLKELTTYTDEQGTRRPLPKQYRYEKMYGPDGVIVK